MTTRTLVTLTPLFAGFFLSEEGESLRITYERDVRVQAERLLAQNSSSFCVQVKTEQFDVYTNSEGKEYLKPLMRINSYRVYPHGTRAFAKSDLVGEKYNILRANMECNDWARVVKTRLGNFQPLEEDDIIL